MKVFDLAVVGAGPAGIMAAISAKTKNLSVILIEANSQAGEKILLTGNGRCNLSHKGILNDFRAKFLPKPLFLKPAFFNFSDQDLCKMFVKNGLKLKEENKGCLFPVTDDAKSVVDLLMRCLRNAGVAFKPKTRIKSIIKNKDIFILENKTKENIFSKKVVLATGGITYPETGSNGDGFSIAKKNGHDLSPLKVALCGIKTKEKWTASLKGVSVKNAALTLFSNNKKIFKDTGDIVFTHFGLSGPLILDATVFLAKESNSQNIIFSFDFLPQLSVEEIQEKIKNLSINKGRMRIKNVFKGVLAQRLSEFLLEKAKVDSNSLLGYLNNRMRKDFVEGFKNCTFFYDGLFNQNKAMVTYGGVKIEQINAKTLESRIVKGLYFAGEIIQGCGLTGGYNLQQAFSTGALSGKMAKESLFGDK